MEEQVYIITEQLNVLIAAGLDKSKPGPERVGLLKGSIKILQGLNAICDATGIEMPDETVAANIELDNKFGVNVLNMHI